MSTLPVWKLTRNRYGRRLYEALAARGITATRMYLYRAAVGGSPPPVDAPDGVALAARAPERLDPGEHADFADPKPGDCAVVAEADGDVVGYLFLTHDRPKRVEALARTYEFDGAYVWRVFVDPAFRGRGIATALAARALGVAREKWGAETACALVAADNRPSQWVFENNEFERRAVVSYYRFLGFERRRRRRVVSEAD